MSLQQLEAVHEEMPQWVEEHLASRELEWRAVQRGEHWSTPELPQANLAELQLALILADPVRFAEVFLHETDVAGHPNWRLFEYQKPSLRYTGNKLHQDGAEVGKTREILAVALYLALTQRGNQLIGAALDGHIAEIWREMDQQFALNPSLYAEVDWKKTKVKPYRDLVFVNGNTIFFRPAGADGTAFRGIHVGLAAFLDEVAKIHAEEAVANFFRACKPGCRLGLYSVPDGRQDTPYYQLCKRSPEVDPFNPPPAPVQTKETAHTQARFFVRFRWPKTLMPAPYWSVAREKELVEQYGGRESSAYLQNVLGMHGEPVTSVFPWARFRVCVGYVESYVCVKISHDRALATFRVEASRLDRNYQVGDRLGADADASAQPMRVFHCEEMPDHELLTGELADRVEAWRRLLGMFFEHREGHHVIGGDFGSINDPTELLVGELRDRRTVVIGRLQMRGVDYDVQADAIRALDSILRPSYGFGFDATGDGKVIGQQLSKHPIDGRLVEFSDFVMNALTEDRDVETGEASTDEGDRPLKVSYKELGTRLLKLAMQRASLRVPHDPDLMLEFPNQTAKRLAGGRVQYSTTNDHLVEACRALELRKMHIDLGDGTSVPLEHATPGGSGRLNGLFGGSSSLRDLPSTGGTGGLFS